MKSIIVIGPIDQIIERALTLAKVTGGRAYSRCSKWGRVVLEVRLPEGGVK